MHYYEDLSPGDRFEFSSYTVSRAEIVEFAEQYDPQPFHLDDEAAADSIFGELIASGWHTASISMRLLTDDVFVDIANLGGRGVDKLRWHRPVFPGDELSGYVEVTEKSPGEEGSGRGDVIMEVTLTNQDDERVLSYSPISIIRRRD